jgi:putative ABC transport system permease protein
MIWTRFFRRRFWDEERARAIEAYLQIETDENMARGMSPEEARYAAHRKLGNATLIREEIYHMNSLGWLETLWQDLRYAIRMLGKDRGFTAVVVLTLALGIGATTAIFTVVNAVLLRPLPYPHPEQLVYVEENVGPAYGGIITVVGSDDFAVWENQSRTLSHVAAYTSSAANLTGGGEAERVVSGLASSSFYSLWGVQPMLGRVFLPEETRPGGPPVVILSEPFWKRRYGGDPSVIGRSITLDGKLRSVVGVLPASFVIPDEYKIDYALWMPLWREMKASPFQAVRVIGRLKPGVSLAAARTELDTIIQSTLKGLTLPEGFTKRVVVLPLHEEITDKSRLSLLLFLGAVGFLLLIACVNVANLLMSRATCRQKEIALRLSVGAARTRIVRQLLTESVLLAVLGGLVGLGLARWVKDLLVRFISPNLPALEPISLDFKVLGFCLALAVVTGLVFGLAPALLASRVSLSEVLKEAGRSASESRSGRLFRNLLTVCETALAMVLLLGAGLLFRSFLRARRIEPGFKPQNILSLSVDLTLSKYPTPTEQSKFVQQAIERIKGLAGVESVGASTCPCLFGGCAWEVTMTGPMIEGGLESLTTTAFEMISSDYFRTMGIPLMRGRNFTDDDREGLPRVAIVNQSFVRRYAHGQNCLGKSIMSWVVKHEKERMTIVGVVGDVRNKPDTEPEPEIYLPYLQAGMTHMVFVVRTARNPMRWAATVRSQIASVDKDQPTHDLMTLEELQAKSLTPQRVNMILLCTFAVLGLALASVGIYGVVSYSVSQRTHEIGVRMALGAERGDVLKIMVGQGLRSVLIGTAVGVAASFGLTRFLQSMLFGVKPTDPVTFVTVSLVLLVVAWLASYIPARRATKVDPMVALRYE